MFSTNAFLEIPSHYDILFFLFFCRTKDDVFFLPHREGKNPSFEQNLAPLFHTGDDDDDDDDDNDDYNITNT